MGLGRKEREMFYSAVKQKLIKTPFATCYRIPTHEKRDAFEPTDRQDFEIDVLEDEPDGSAIIWEIKDDADAKAIGQLLLYENLIRKLERYKDKKTFKAILCHTIKREIKETAENLNIMVFFLKEKKAK